MSETRLYDSAGRKPKILNLSGNLFATTCKPYTDRPEAISEHLRSHIEEEHAEDGVCEHQGCHANLYALTADVRKCVLINSILADKQ